MDKQKARAILKELAKNGSQVFFSKHAEDRMITRNITRMQVFRCLQSGNFEEEPAQNTRGSWVMRLRSHSAGESIAVAVALDKNNNGEYAVIITVMN